MGARQHRRAVAEMVRRNNQAATTASDSVKDHTFNELQPMTPPDSPSPVATSEKALTRSDQPQLRACESDQRAGDSGDSIQEGQ